MGFRANAYATVWEIKEGKGNYWDARISTSKKDKRSGQYYTDFSSYVRFVGNAALKAADLQPERKIRIKDCEASNHYDKVKEKLYTNYVIYDFDIVNSNVIENQSPAPVSQSSGESTADDFMNEVTAASGDDFGWIDGSDDDKLPFA